MRKTDRAKFDALDLGLPAPGVKPRPRRAYAEPTHAHLLEGVERERLALLHQLEREARQLEREVWLKRTSSRG